MNNKMKKTMVSGFALLAVLVMVLSLTGFIEESVGVCIALSMTVIFTLIIAVMAYKNDVKILTGLMVVFMLIGLILLVFNIHNLFKTSEKKSDYQISVKKSNSSKTILFNHDNHNYYLLNLSEVNIAKNKKTRSLKETITDGHVKLEDILSNAIPNENTEGYKIYYDGGDKDSDALSIVVCEDSNDVIFANFEYTYEDGLCSSN